ncbi:NERD domain-containing protein [Ruminococcaceae bacterium OttesenSCG-928-L11]|nr:NERD domain-containing protein [Ruminococcaceae bacterium OttesenSCG-928-L11]
MAQSASAMGTMELILIIVMAVLFFGALGFGLYLLSINVLNPDGKGASKKTTRVLSKFALIRGFKVLTNVRFEHKGRAFHIENMLIGYFGILLVHTLGGRGEYYGQMDSKSWQLVRDEKKQVFPNPYLEQEDAMAALRSVFSQHKVFNVPMENLIVLTNKSRKTALFITNDNKIFFPGKLKPYLDKTKFEKDAGIDIQKVTQIIEALSAETA